MVTTPPRNPPTMRFERGATYTRDQIHAAVGGSKRSAIPTLNGRVVAVCIRTDLNAKAPEEFLCGVGPVRVKAGNLLASTLGKVPVFTKTNVNQWAYKGLFRVAASHRSGPGFDAMVAGSGRSLSSVSVAIELTQ
jgi:hypothetical protein